MSWDSLGHAYHHLGEHRRAIECYRRALELVDESAYRLVRALVVHRLGDAHHALGELPDARSVWQTALKLFLELDHPDANDVRAKLDRLDREP